MRQITLLVPSFGIESNATVQMLPDHYWPILARQFRHKVECLSRKFRLEKLQAKGASASGPKPNVHVDMDWVLHMPRTELSQVANRLGVSEDGQTKSEMQSAVIGELLDQQAVMVTEEELEKGSTTATAPPMGASSSGSTSRKHQN